MTEVSEPGSNLNTQEKTSASPNMTGQTSNTACPNVCQDAEPALSLALYRVTRAMIFENRPIPELNALPMAQLRLLWAVRFSPDATMKDLSERLSVTQSTVTQLADRLVRRNFIVRNPDPQDRRVVRLRLSEAGFDIVQKADNERRALARATWDMLSGQEREKVMQGLEVLGDAAEAALAAEGRPLAPLPKQLSNPVDRTSKSDTESQSHPVVDLMSVRVRGR